MPKYKRSPTIHTTPFLNRASRMPSPRRLKTLTLLVLIAIVLLLFYRSSGSESDQDVGDFYYKTKTALDQKAEVANHGHVHAEAEVKGDDEDLELTKKMSERLKQAAQVAKSNANAKAPKPDPPSSVIGVGSSAGGKDKDKESMIPGVAGVRRKKADDQKVATVETKEDHEVEMELNMILRKAPVIIYSKSYCPHSQQAKEILLNKYIIDPAPYVVELDKHPLGVNLQGALAVLTKRATVPNVLVNGLSIGGGDDMVELDETGKLAEKIKEYGGKKIFEVRLRAGSNREREKEKEEEKQKEKAKSRVRLVHGSDPSI